MDQSREVSIRIQKHPSFGLKDSSFEEGKKVELQETVKLRPENDHGDSFIISKRKRDGQRKEESAGNELEDCGFPHRLSSNTWLLASSDHNQQGSNGVMSVVVPKKARSSNNLIRKKHKTVGLQTFKSSSLAIEEHNETEITELLYGLKTSSRNQNSSETLQTNGAYENNKVDLMTSKRSAAAESVEIENKQLDDGTKSCVTNKDIKKVNLESIDLMAPPPTDLELGNYNIKIEEDKETFKKNQDVIKIDIEVPNKDNDIWTNHVNKTVSPAWARNLPPLGYLLPPLPPIGETDKTTRSSSTTQQLVDFVLSPPQPKRCASHHYIACNIFLHQRLLRVSSSSLCGTRSNNVDNVPTPESMTTGQQSHEKKELVALKFPSLHTNKSPDARHSVDSMQMEQQGPPTMHQPSPPSPAAQNSSISIGLPSPHKQSYGAQLKQSHKLMGETCEEKSAAIVGQKNVYSQNLTIPVQPKNENLGDSKQEPNLNGGFDFELVSSQSFAISFHSQPSVAWQGYYSAWNTTQQGDEKKVNSGKSSSSPSSTNGPIATLVFDDDSSKYLSFVLSPENRTCLDHSMASSSQHLRQLHKQQNVQQQKKPPMVRQNFPQCNSPNSSFHSRSSRRRPLDSQHCYSGARKNFSSSCTNIFW